MGFAISAAVLVTPIATWWLVGDLSRANLGGGLLVIVGPVVIGGLVLTAIVLAVTEARPPLRMYPDRSAHRSHERS